MKYLKALAATALLAGLCASAQAGEFATAGRPKAPPLAGVTRHPKPEADRPEGYGIHTSQITALLQ